MYPDPGPLASEQIIRFNLFRFLSGKKCSSICPEKATENSIQMVNAQYLNRKFDYKLLEALLCVQIHIMLYILRNKRPTVQWSHNFASSFAKINMASWKKKLNPKIAERKCPAFKPGKELSNSLSRWNNLTQTPACDLKQNCCLAGIPFNYKYGLLLKEKEHITLPVFFIWHFSFVMFVATSTRLSAVCPKNVIISEVTWLMSSQFSW